MLDCWRFTSWMFTFSMLTSCMLTSWIFTWYTLMPLKSSALGYSPIAPWPLEMHIHENIKQCLPFKPSGIFSSWMFSAPSEKLLDVRFDRQGLRKAVLWVLWSNVYQMWGPKLKNVSFLEKCFIKNSTNCTRFCFSFLQSLHTRSWIIYSGCFKGPTILICARTTQETLSIT